MLVRFPEVGKMAIDGEILIPERAAGMTVNERLWVAGLMPRYDDAVAKRDVDEIAEILRKVYLNQETIDAVIDFELEDK